MEATITRIKSTSQTIGEWTIEGNPFTCKTVELKQKNNTKKISCINDGVYTVIKRHSPRYGNHFQVLGAEGRGLILILGIGFSEELWGSIGVGENFKTQGSVKTIDKTTETLDKLLAIMPDKFKLTIK